MNSNGDTDDDIVGDGVGAPGDIAPPSACGTTVLVSDDFSSPSVGSEWTLTQAADLTMTQSDGLNIAFGSSAAADETAGYKLNTELALKNACLVVEVSQIPDPTTSALLQIIIGATSENVRFEEFEGNLRSIYQSGNLQDHLDIRSYDGAAQRFLRLRNINGTMWDWEVSPDNVVYTTIASSATPSVPNTSGFSILAATTTVAIENAGTCVYRSVSVVN